MKYFKLKYTIHNLEIISARVKRRHEIDGITCSKKSLAKINQGDGRRV
jgi:hypothetical protein